MNEFIICPRYGDAGVRTHIPWELRTDCVQLTP
jgi:hypothetical protein